jgi:hypothetical protein
MHLVLHLALLLALHAQSRIRAGLQSQPGDWLIALPTVAKFTRADRCQRQAHSAQMSTNVGLIGHRHLLLLHGIHARQAADHLLIQLDRLAVLLQLLQLRLQISLETAKVRLQLGALLRGKFLCSRHPLPATNPGFRE